MHERAETLIGDFDRPRMLDYRGLERLAFESCTGHYYRSLSKAKRFRTAKEARWAAAGGMSLQPIPVPQPSTLSADTVALLSPPLPPPTPTQALRARVLEACDLFPFIRARTPERAAEVHPCASGSKPWAGFERMDSGSGLGWIKCRDCGYAIVEGATLDRIERKHRWGGAVDFVMGGSAGDFKTRGVVTR